MALESVRNYSRIELLTIWFLFYRTHQTKDAASADWTDQSGAEYLFLVVKTSSQDSTFIQVNPLTPEMSPVTQR